MYSVYYIFVLILIYRETYCNVIFKRALQKSHEKPKADKYMEVFFGKKMEFDQSQSLVSLLNMLSSKHLNNCTPIILYDNLIEEHGKNLLLEQLFRELSKSLINFSHGQILKTYVIKNKVMLNSYENKCVSYILFMADVMKLANVIGEQNKNKVIVVAQSSQWRVHEFLASDYSQYFFNLLVISKSERVPMPNEELPYILYTHDMYTDALGSSVPRILTSWLSNNLTRPNVNLFPEKIYNGFAGHRFLISIAHQPPFVVNRGDDDNNNIEWDGIDVRLINLLSEMYNFTVDFKPAKETHILNSGDAVVAEVKNKKANLGIGGIYTTSDRIAVIDVASSHAQDCAAFISLTSTALPKYRAIMGPFHWTVWVAITSIYLFAIFPISFSDNHSLRYLFSAPEEIENMFWYVFGTFTNCFTFTGVHTWNKSKKVTTRILIGFYWIFTIITTACYTGSIIAFVTIPVYPTTIDTVKQLLSNRYQIGTLDKGGWERWFRNTSDPYTEKLLERMEYVSSVEAGLRNTTKAFFWSYAFLGSRAELDYVVRTNFSTESKRSVLHISSECFAPFGISIIFSVNSIYTNILNRGILRAVQSGFVIKYKHDVEWNIMRSASGKLLQANSAGALPKALTIEDRALNLDDTQGMFLLLAFGFVIGGSFFISEFLGGCINFCKRRRMRSAHSIESKPRLHSNPTPREKNDSIQLNKCPIEIDSNENEDEITVDIEIIDTNHIAENSSFENNIDNPENDTENNNNDDTDNKIQLDSNSTENYEFIKEEIEKIFNFEDVFGDDNNNYSDYSEEIDIN